MSTVIVAVILIGFITAITLPFLHIEKQRKRRHMIQFLTRLTELGALNNLTFSSQELLQDAAIGLDGVHRKLLVLSKENDNTFHDDLLCLRDIKSCAVKKQYGSIGAAGFKKNGLERYLENITLCFELKNGAEPVEVTFFNHITGDVYQIKQMEDKARQWEAILSRMLPPPLKEAA